MSFLYDRRLRRILSSTFLDALSLLIPDPAWVQSPHCIKNPAVGNSLLLSDTGRISLTILVMHEALPG